MASESDDEVCGVRFAIVKKRAEVGPGPWNVLRDLLDVEITASTTFSDVLSAVLRDYASISEFLVDNNVTLALHSSEDFKGTGTPVTNLKRKVVSSTPNSTRTCTTIYMEKLVCMPLVHVHV